jgi:hypothetical protein
MKKCRCLDRDVPWSYPSRLISLKQLKERTFVYEKYLDSTIKDTEAEVKVQLVEKRGWEDDKPAEHVRYVTLSHCWGILPEAQRKKLTRENIEEFKRGIKLSELPETFRQAMKFAARLPEVGYIWIDSLCIIQGDLTDWLEQSASMGEVYSNAFLNLSATAATDSSKGLFAGRAPEILVEDEVILNIAGLPGALSSSQNLSPQFQNARKSVLQYLGTFWPVRWLMAFLLRRLYSQTLILPVREDKKPTMKPASTNLSTLRYPHQLSSNRLDGGTGEDAKGKHLRRCTILDLSFWTHRVDEAPVNKRGWVLQERLMAPRVLHFCRDQVAWECCEFEAAEGQPEGIPNYQLTLNGIRAGSRLKGLDPLKDGAWLRNMRLQGYDDPDPHLQPGIYAFELWRRIVEVYSKTAVTNSGDKLIALSGIARQMSEKIEKTPKAVIVRRAHSAEVATSQARSPATTQYVAGLWALHLESQLLWYTEPTFRHVDGGKFEHLTKAPPPTSYRAPSFSWAAIDAENGNGITYGEVTDQDILIDVEEASVTPRSQSDEFGMLDDAYIILHVKLRKAFLSKKGKDRFGWKLVGRQELDDEEHTDVYLDCPARDGVEDDNEGILGHDAGIFVVPAAHTDRKASPKSKYLTCLILQLDRTREAGPVFRRIGLTKLSPYGDHRALDNDELLKPYDSDMNMLRDVDYDPTTGRHRIFLV